MPICYRPRSVSYFVQFIIDLTIGLQLSVFGTWQHKLKDIPLASICPNTVRFQLFELFQVFLI